MKLHQSSAGIYVPDGVPLPQALERVTHLGVGAHHDDLEFMALHGILACYDAPDRWFGGVTCTDGRGSARTGAFSNFTDEELQATRRKEQNDAASIGQYGVMIQLDHGSRSIKQPGAPELTGDLQTILATTWPRVIYTHNLADKHDTHIAVVLAVLRAVRAMPPEDRPKQVWGCEVWRGLDWMLDTDKIVMDVSGHAALTTALNGVFASQIAGGKRYDLATVGRRVANATFFDPHSTDKADQVIFGMDLTPLAHDDSLDVASFADAFVDRFRADVASQLRKQLGHD